MRALIGYTGFVGSNLCEQTSFDVMYNSKNIFDSYGKSYDLVVYAGLRAEKYLANQQPVEDRVLVENAIKNIKMINMVKFVLISTVDVYKEPVGVDETTAIAEEGLHPYGLHRRMLEKWVEENVPDFLIIRLPALYGKNLKKNFIYDMINLIPSMIRKEKFQEILQNSMLELKKYYSLQSNGFYRLKQLPETERKKLKEYFENYEFNALSFTDSRNKYQFYNLKYLWSHIEKALANGIKFLNISTEPIAASEVFAFTQGKTFKNFFPDKKPLQYDIRTVHADLFGGRYGYIFDKQFVLEDIKHFIEKGR
ncbi:MAG TPA: NAD(P)-dependent oxidoreductase [Bacillota bacterium]|nr:NAD(P)-dependent oxidoreductase [Bacillota bacterium]